MLVVIVMAGGERDEVWDQETMFSQLAKRQSAKTADWQVDNDVIWPVLRNCACTNPRKLKIDQSMAAEREGGMLKRQGPTRLLFVEKEITKYSKKP